MTWARLEDRFPWHRKVRPLSDAAFRLHVSGICWATEHGTNGKVLTEELALVSDVRQPAKAVSELEKRGLWDVLPDGWEIHDYLAYNPSAEKVRADREARHEAKVRAGKLGGLASGRSRQSKNEAEPKQTNEADAKQTGSTEQKQNEAPSRPVPIETSSLPRAAKHTIPADWQPTAEDRAWATAECPLVNLERETGSFVDFFLDKGEKRPGWSRSWKRWMREAQSKAETRPGLRSVPTDDRRAMGYLGAWDV